MDVLIEREFVLAHVVRRLPRADEDVARIAEDRRELLVRKDLERRVIDVAHPVVGVLAGNDPVVQKGVGERRQRTVEVRPPPGEREAVGIHLARREADHPRRARSDVGSVEVGVVEDAVHRTGGVPGEHPQKDAGTVVDLRAVHLLVAGDVHEAIAELELGQRLLPRRRKRARREEERGEKRRPYGGALHGVT
jgi:hypothetical protein